MLSLLIAVLLTADVECARDFPSRCSVDVTAGQKTPFDGQLVTPDMAIFLGQSAQACGRRIQIEVTATVAATKADDKRDYDVLHSDLVHAERERDFYKKQADIWFFERPAFLVPVTAVLAIFATAFAIDKWEEARRNATAK